LAAHTHHRTLEVVLEAMVGTRVPRTSNPVLIWYLLFCSAVCASFLSYKQTFSMTDVGLSLL